MRYFSPYLKFDGTDCHAFLSNESTFARSRSALDLGLVSAQGSTISLYPSYKYLKAKYMPRGFVVGITLTELSGYNSGPFIRYPNNKTIIPMIPKNEPSMIPAPVNIEGTASFKTSDHFIFYLLSINKYNKNYYI